MQNFDGLPLVVGMELTLACNLRCEHCASCAGLARNDELSLDEIIDICDQFPQLLVQEVDFTGGEPLVRPDWPQIAKHLQHLQIPVRMVTNGLLLEENVQAIVDSGISTVGISVDGLEHTHDQIRNQPGLFKKIIAGIRLGLEAGIPIAAITAVNHKNINDLSELYTFLQDLGIKHWQVQPTFARGRAKSGKLDLSESSFMQLGEFVYEYRKTCRNGGIEMMPADGLGYYTHLDTIAEEWDGCSAGFSTCGITSDGKIKGCLSMPDTMVEGDLRENTLWDIWFSDEAFKYNRQFKLEDLGKYCIGCKYDELCKGGCSVMSWSATTSFHNDPYCFYRILSSK